MFFLLYKYIKTDKRKISSSQDSKLKAETSCLSESKSKFQLFLMNWNISLGWVPIPPGL